MTKLLGAFLPASNDDENYSISPDGRWSVANRRHQTPVLSQLSEANQQSSAIRVDFFSGAVKPLLAGFTRDGLLALYQKPGPLSKPRWPWIVAAAPFILLVAFWFWLWLRRARLRRFSSIEGLNTNELRPPDAAAPFNGPLLRMLGQEMRRRKPVPSQELAIDATLAATIDCGGFFSPVFGSQKIQREFLVLVQKLGAADQHAFLYLNLCKRLRAQDSHITAYTFKISPIHLQDPETGKSIRIEDIAGRHPIDDLWIIADPTLFQDAFTGDLPLWVAELSRWQDRAVLSSTPIPGWTTRSLEEAGFRVTVASVDGVAALLETSESERDLKLRPDPAYPQSLTHVRSRWMDRVAPSHSEIAEMLSDLRRYLGPEAMQVVAAAAVYPEISWFLTLWLASELCGAPERRDSVLARIAVLPWFRYGWMPDWLRAHLVSRLTQGQEKRVRAVIDRFLGQSLGPVDPDEVHKKEEHIRILKHAEKGEKSEGKPLKDYVLFEFLAGRKPDEKLAVRPPSTLRKLLFQDGYAAFGPRILPQFALALVLAVALWFAMQPFAPPVQGATQLELARYKMPVVSRPPKLDLPVDSLHRAVLEVAEAYANGSPLPANTSFLNATLRYARLFANGEFKMPDPVPVRTPTPADAFQTRTRSGIVESVNGPQVFAVVSDGNKITHLSTTATPPYLHYSVPGQTAVSEPVSPTARITANFAEGTVVLDNRSVGRLQDGQFVFEQLPPGRHTLQIYNGGGRASVSFEVDYAKLPSITNLTTMNTKLIALGSFGNRAEIFCSGCSGAVSIDDHEVGNLKKGTTTINLPPGTYRVKVGAGQSLVFTASGAPSINLAVFR